MTKLTIRCIYMEYEQRCSFFVQIFSVLKMNAFFIYFERKVQII
ncbi:hypothetical protein BLAHAN_04156 [Blautia hansenii DSM 20583]|uniref:Uncharacterized protein n=1 Tax=Blautia hansenii DSM 20583 TaxID=537007 RepID=C9L468_BLAHA|nr:hypothetical protein BLAHAN_04156 [Blautia hansenii DSM 20583]